MHHAHHAFPKIRIDCLTPAFSGGQKRAEMLHHPYILGDPQTKGDKITSGYLTSAFLGAEKRVEMLHHPCILGGPQQRRQNQSTKNKKQKKVSTVSLTLPA